MGFPRHLDIAVNAGYEADYINNSVVVREVFSKYDVESINILAQALKFSYRLHLSQDGQVGRLLEDGNWTGLMGMVFRQEVDVAVAQVVLTEQRQSALPFSYPFMISQLGFATRKPEYVTDAGAILKPFSYTVWIAVIASLLTMILLFYLFFKRSRDFSKICFSTFATSINQSSEIQPRHSHEYWLFAAWFLSVAFITYSYQALLLSSLTFPPLTSVRTIPELAAAVTSGRYECCTYPGSFVIDELQKSSDKNVRIIGQNLEVSRSAYVLTDILDFPLYPKLPAFVGASHHFIPFKNIYVEAKDTFFATPLAIPLRKGFCCKAELDKVIGYVNAGGLYEQLHERIGYREIGMKKHKDVEHNITLTIAHFKAIFAFLICGHSLAVLVFSMEVIHNKWTLSRRRRSGNIL